jgi:hypothetical protein
MATGESNSDINMTQHRRWFADMTTVVPGFDQVNGALRIDKVEENAILYDWDDVTVQHFALTKLSGVARLWKDSLPREERSWLQWVPLLKENFPSTNEDVVRIKLDAQNFKRKSGQNMIEYFYEKLSRCNRAKMDNVETIQWVVHGIGNDRYRDYLGPLSIYKRPSELLPHLISASEYIKCDKEREIRKQSLSINVKPRTLEMSDSKKSSIVCFRCRVVGHTSKECTKKANIVFFRCSTPGHKSNECRSRKSKTDNAETNTVPIINSTADNGGRSQQILQLDGSATTQNKYFKNAIVNDTCIHAYIDMGAS